MEDYELVKRLRKHGPPAIIPHAIHTSGRRWQTVGFLRTTLTNQVSFLVHSLHSQLAATAAGRQFRCTHAVQVLHRQRCLFG